MGEWNTVYEDEVEGRWVTVKVYASDDDEDGDEGPVVLLQVSIAISSPSGGRIEGLEGFSH